MRKRLTPRQTRKMQTERTKTRKIGPIRITTTTTPKTVSTFFPPEFLKRRTILIGERKGKISRIAHESTKFWNAKTGIRSAKITFTRIGHRKREKTTTYNSKGKKKS